MTQNKYFKPFECYLVFILVYWARIINYCIWYNIFCNHQELRYLTLYLRRLLNFILDILLRFAIVNWPINCCILLVRIEISYRERKPVSSPSLSLQRRKVYWREARLLSTANSINAYDRDLSSIVYFNLSAILLIFVDTVLYRINQINIDFGKKIFKVDRSCSSYFIYLSITKICLTNIKT